MNIKATLAANKQQSLSEMGAAFGVITREDMASSGANNIPSLLRSDAPCDLVQRSVLAG
jgi:outer membrane cobalamin receptor